MTAAAGRGAQPPAARPAGAAAAAATALLLGAAAALAGHAAGTGGLRLAVLLLLAPLAEEAVFRAGLQEAMLRRGATAAAANAATALAFGLAHAALRGDPRALLVALPALLAGAVYGRWRRLRWCVALHSAFNALWLLAMLSGLPGS